MKILVGVGLGRDLLGVYFQTYLVLVLMVRAPISPQPSLLQSHVLVNLWRCLFADFQYLQAWLLAQQWIVSMASSSIARRRVRLQAQ